MCSTRGENNDPAGECTPVGVCVKAHSNYNPHCSGSQEESRQQQAAAETHVQQSILQGCSCDLLNRESPQLRRDEALRSPTPAFTHTTSNN